jgi:hypothetical protein
LLVADSFDRVFRQQAEEMHAVVIERVPRAAKMFPPNAVHRGVGDIVVAGDEKEPHVELVDEPQKLTPLAFDLVNIFGVTLDQVADRNDELGPQQVEIPHALHPHARPMATGAVGHHGKLKSIGVAQHWLIRPRPGVAFDLRQRERGRVVRGVFATGFVGRMRDRGRNEQKRRAERGQQSNGRIQRHDDGSEVGRG